MRRVCGLVFGVLALLVGAHPQGLANTGLDLGYRQLYNLDFPAAHRTFAAWMYAHPADPLGPASNAAAYLFAEMDRLHILQSQFFTEDHRFLTHGQGVPDPAAAAAFAANLSLSRGLAAGRLRAVPGDQNAHFSEALCDGLDADYQVLIQDHTLAALRLMKDGQSIADRLLVAAPDDYDAELALGMENYVLGLQPAPIRWLLRLDGAAANQGRGIAQLEAVAQHGHLLRPYAKILLALAALRAHHPAEAAPWLEDLANEFPGNPLYAQELRRIAATVQFQPADTIIHFTLGAFLHTVHGTMPLASGRLQFDPASGAASGRIVIDAAQAETGNAGRDRTMRHDVLESDQFPQIVFTPSRISPTPAPSGDSTVTLQGTISIAGGEHPISFPARVHIAGGTVTASASFPIDYVAWGLHNPSTLLLRVGNTVQVAIETRGTINWPR